MTQTAINWHWRAQALPVPAKQMGLGERMVRTYVERAVLYCRAGLNAAQVWNTDG
jgi:hypothetical protein